jgi:hypothetical protein
VAGAVVPRTRPVPEADGVEEARVDGAAPVAGVDEEDLRFLDLAVVVLLFFCGCCSSLLDDDEGGEEDSSTAPSAGPSSCPASASPAVAVVSTRIFVLLRRGSAWDDGLVGAT